MLRRGSPGPRTGPGAWAVIGFLAVLVAVQHARALGAPFFSDDYIFFDKLKGAPFGDVWAPRNLAYQWYRPWSRELHYWTFLRFFGVQPLPYHLASFALWLAAMGLYFSLVSRITGRAAGAIASCGVASLAAWGVLLEWAPGVQDLWMLGLSLASLNAFARRHRGWASVALALALLSKETAAVLPAIAFAYAVAIDRDSPRAALRRILPLAILVVLWAMLHPALGGRLWWARHAPPLPAVHTSPLTAGGRSLLALANLDLAPRPLSGWAAALVAGLPGALVLGALAAWALFAGAPRDETPARPIAFGAAWMLIGWLPLLAPSVLWQPYYSLFGALGAWIAIAALIRQAPGIALALVLALALLRGVRADTPSRDWGNESLQRFGKSFMGYTESHLKQRFPTLPRHARLFFTAVPRGVVLITNPYEAPALRVWYGKTVKGSFWSDYRLRASRDSLGPDYFFRFDSLAGWVEVKKGPENVDSARAANPQWKADHERLGFSLAQAADLSGAAAEYQKLADAFPEIAEYPFLAGMSHEAMGDSAAAAIWYGRAARLPGADEEARAKARRFGRIP